MIFSKTQFWFFLSLYHIKWIVGYCGARDAYHLFSKITMVQNQNILRLKIG